MPRILLAPVVLLPLALLMGADPEKPKPPATDWQKWADDAAWKPPAEDLGYCLANEARAYDVTRKKESRGVLTIRVSDGDAELYSFGAHTGTMFFERNGVLYHTEYSRGVNGCVMVAFDLRAKKQLWKTHLKGIGEVQHSAYTNEVRMNPYLEGVLVVYGNESFGKYVEVLDIETGKTVGHKVFKEEKK